MSYTLHHGDCLDLMRDVPSGSVDMILCDLPYQTTRNAWDTIIPLSPLWEQYRRVIKPGGAIVLTAAQPFTSALVMSNPKAFRYEWIWRKSRPVGHLNAKRQPMNAHESVLVFGAKGQYFPQGTRPTFAKITRTNNGCYGAAAAKPSIQTTTGYPNTVLEFKADPSAGHPTQKPVALFEYLIRTYTNPGELVMDNCAGSGTTGVAAINTGRRAILMEQETAYCAIIRARCDAALATAPLFATAQ